jgi:NTP pyrophosphatase (non-canonical NTP hydrolase)
MTTFDRPSGALDWAVKMFGPVALDAKERAMRFVEEATELAHALHIPRATVEALVERVYGRERGDVAREVGQSQMTLELLAKAINIDLDAEADKEFFRIQSIPKEEWTRRHQAKVALGIAS